MSNVQHNPKSKSLAVEEEKTVLKHFGQLEIELEIDNWKFLSPFYFSEEILSSVCSDINVKSIEGQQNSFGWSFIINKPGKKAFCSMQRSIKQLFVLFVNSSRTHSFPKEL